MPLAFQSLSHGTVAFGFFNIEADLLLLDRCFFFASDFCNQVLLLAGTQPAGSVLRLAWVIEEPAAIGDLMGAIAGKHHTGLIGAVYRQFPFPQEPAGFKQKPDGWKTRPILFELLRHFAVRRDLPVAVSEDGAMITIGDYRFGRSGFHELLDYIWRGGYPRWEGGTRPEYVLRMAQAAQASSNLLFAGLAFSHIGKEHQNDDRRH